MVLIDVCGKVTDLNFKELCEQWGIENQMLSKIGTFWYSDIEWFWISDNGTIQKRSKNGGHFVWILNAIQNLIAIPFENWTQFEIQMPFQIQVTWTIQNLNAFGFRAPLYIGVCEIPKKV